METKEKVLTALGLCYKSENNVCKECPYFAEKDCVDELMGDAMLIIEDQEAQIEIYESLLNGD